MFTKQQIGRLADIAACIVMSKNELEDIFSKMIAFAENKTHLWHVGDEGKKHQTQLEAIACIIDLLDGSYNVLVNMDGILIS